MSCTHVGNLQRHVVQIPFLRDVNTMPATRVDWLVAKVPQGGGLGGRGDGLLDDDQLAVVF